MHFRYRAYREGPAQTGLYSEAAETEARAKGLLTHRAELLWEIHVATLEEALAVYHLRMGFEPYVPEGNPQPCPKCGAVFYPEGSGQCWRCGRIC
jgi:hypothetical protein